MIASADFDVVGKICVDPPGLIARPLVHAQVEEDAQAVDFDQVTRAGDGAVGAAELDSHCRQA